MLTKSIQNKKDFIGSITPYFLFCYIILASIPSATFSSEWRGLSLFSNQLFSLVYRGTVFLLFAAFVILLTIVNGCKIRREHLVFSILLFVVTLLGTCVFPTTFSFLDSSSATDSEIIQIEVGSFSLIYSIIQPIITILFLIIFSSIIPVALDKKNMSRFLVLILLFSLFVASYAVCFQSGLIEKMTNLPSYINRNIYNSIFGNKNIFSKFIYFGFLASIIYLVLNYHQNSAFKNSLFIISGLFLLAVCFVSQSRTPIVVLVLSLVIVMFTIGTKFDKKQKRIYYFVLFALLIVIVSVLLIIVFIPSLQVGLLKNVRDYVLKTIDLFKTGSGRIEKIEYTLKYLFLFPKLFFGYGDRVSIDVLNQWTSNLSYAYLTQRSFDNSYITLLVGRGIFGLLLYVYSIFSCLRFMKFKEQPRLKILFISLLIGYMIYGLSETMLFFASTVDGTIATMLFISVPLALNKDELSKNQNECIRIKNIVIESSLFTELKQLFNLFRNKKILMSFITFSVSLTISLSILPNYSLFKSSVFLNVLYFSSLIVSIVLLFVSFHFKKTACVDSSVESSIITKLFIFLAPFLSMVVVFIISGVIYHFIDASYFLINPFLSNVIALLVLSAFVAIQLLNSKLKRKANNQ